MQEPELDQTEWYCLQNGVEKGPFSTADLVDFVQSGRLRHDSQLKISRSGEWFRAGDVECLFNETSKYSASRAAAEILMKGPYQVVFPRESSPMFRVNQTGSGRINSVLNLLFDTVLNWIIVLGRPFRPLARPWVGITAVILLTVFGTFRVYGVPCYYQKTALQTYMDVADEIGRLERQDASELEISEYFETVSPRVVRTTSALENSADAESYYYQELLRAGRDYLPKMVDSTPLEKLRAGINFKTHIKRAISAKQRYHSGHNIVSGYLIILIGLDATLLCYVAHVFLIWRRG